MLREAGEDRAAPCRSTFLFCLTAITVGALALRLYRLDAESLYMDELTTAETFYRDPWGIVMSAAYHGQPPLDNFIGAALCGGLGTLWFWWFVHRPGQRPVLPA